MPLTLYTDGACRGNPGLGGYGAIVEDGANRTELSGGFRWTTNNRMEIASVIVALETLPPGAPIHLVSDSQYVLNTLSKGWIAGWKRRGWIGSTKEPVKNRDLWERLDALLVRRAMTYQWVKGHAAHPLNNRCDALAVAAALGSTLAIDVGYEAINPYPDAAPVVPVIVPVPLPVLVAKAKPTPVATPLGQGTLPGF